MADAPQAHLGAFRRPLLEPERFFRVPICRRSPLLWAVLEPERVWSVLEMSFGRCVLETECLAGAS
jgi:hypothetical protein